MIERMRQIEKADRQAPACGIRRDGGNGGGSQSVGRRILGAHSEALLRMPTYSARSRAGLPEFCRADRQSDPRP